jgi:hypothetical protein
LSLSAAVFLAAGLSLSCLLRLASGGGFAFLSVASSPVYSPGRHSKQEPS